MKLIGISRLTSPDEQCRTTNEAISRKFRDYFVNLFTREPGLSSAQLNTYLADFPRPMASEGMHNRISSEGVENGRDQHDSWDRWSAQ